MSSIPRLSASKYILSILNFHAPGGVYELAENGIIYKLTYQQFNQLKAGRLNTVEEWYSSLNKFERKEVKRSGNIEIEDNGFYPDE